MAEELCVFASAALTLARDNAFLCKLTWECCLLFEVKYKERCEAGGICVFKGKDCKIWYYIESAIAFSNILKFTESNAMFYLLHTFCVSIQQIKRKFGACDLHTVYEMRWDEMLLEYSYIVKEYLITFLCLISISELFKKKRAQLSHKTHVFILLVLKMFKELNCCGFLTQGGGVRTKFLKSVISHFFLCLLLFGCIHFGFSISLTFKHQGNSQTSLIIGIYCSYIMKLNNIDTTWLVKSCVCWLQTWALSYDCHLVA